MERKTVKISEIKTGPIRKEVLPEGFIVRVQKFKEILKEVETSSLEETISNFQHDAHPVRELEIWETIAEQYQIAEIENPDWSQEEKREYFKKLLFSTAS